MGQDLSASNPLKEGSHPEFRRKIPRYYTDLEVEIQQQYEIFEGRIKQISRGGCLTLPTLPSRLQPKVRVSFRLPEAPTPINCKGEVIYSINDKGTGIAFTEISEHSSDLITEHFEKGTSKMVAAGKLDSDRLIRAGHCAPLRTKRMATLACSLCGEHFVIVHPLRVADAARAKKQAARYSRELSREHSEENFQHHLDSYGGLENG